MDSKLKRTVILVCVLMMITVFGVVILTNWSRIERTILSQPQESFSESEEELTASESMEGISTAESEADLKAFLSDDTFFDEEISSFQKKMMEENSNALDLIITSVEKDMRVQIINSKGNLVTGMPFYVEVKDNGSYKDLDQDGVVYIGGLKAGQYEVSLEQMDGFEMPDTVQVTVKDRVEYTPISDISLLIKTEDEIVAAEEDTAVQEALEDADKTEVTDIRELGGNGQMGIDVSKYQEVIDWDKVREAGIKFAIIRLGYRGSSSGALVEDPYYRQNIQGALNAGIKVGVYFFTQAVNEVEAVEEASMAISLLEGYNITYPVFIDTEGAGGNGRADHIGVEARTAVCRAFCETIENAGLTGGIYASKNWYNNNLQMQELERFVIWLAEYRSIPEYQGYYQLWQYTSSGYVDGINGRVDLNISYLTY